MIDVLGDTNAFDSVAQLRLIRLTRTTDVMLNSIDGVIDGVIVKNNFRRR